MRDLQLGPNPGNDCPVLAPIKLESFPRCERQGHECPTPANLLLAPIIFAPVPSKSGNPVVGSFITQAHQRSEEHTSELQSLMRISYAVFCFKIKNLLRK